MTYFLDNIEKDLSAASLSLSYLQGMKDQLEKEKNQAQQQLQALEDQDVLFTKAQMLLVAVSEQARQSVVAFMEKLVTEGLQEILQNPHLVFKILVSQKRGVTGVEFKLQDGETGMELDVQKCEAGTVKDLVGTILRLVVLELAHPKIQGPVILDEVGKNIAPAYQENFAKFLRKFSETTGRQIILVSHEANLITEAHRVISLSRRNGVSSVEYKK